jgi:hypothetical protein
MAPASSATINAAAFLLETRHRGDAYYGSKKKKIKKKMMSLSVTDNIHWANSYIHTRLGILRLC